MLAAVIVLSIVVLGFLFRTFYNLGYAQGQRDNEACHNPKGHNWL